MLIWKKIPIGALILVYLTRIWPIKYELSNIDFESQRNHF